MRFEHWIYTIPLRLRALFHRNRMDSELDEEIRDHLNRQIEFNLAGGMSPEEARLAALRKLGNAALLRDQTRATWNWNALEQFIHDLRIGVRTLRRTPGFTLVALLVMALGIGANVALFTVVRSVLLKPLAYSDSERLALIYEADNTQPHPAPWLPVDAGSFWEWQRSTQSLAQMALVSPFQGYNVSGEGGKLPEVVEAAWCTDNFFSLLGVQPMLGRSFTADDDKPGAPATAMITAGFWKRRYASDPAITGKTMWLMPSRIRLSASCPRRLYTPARLGAVPTRSGHRLGARRGIICCTPTEITSSWPLRGSLREFRWPRCGAC